jgi:hypothetical protein
MRCRYTISLGITSLRETPDPAKLALYDALYSNLMAVK